MTETADERLCERCHLPVGSDEATLCGEIERLRAALRQIANASDWHPDDMQRLARAALAGAR